jgi:hypothetical protein
MLCLIADHDSAETHKKLMLTKANTFAKVVEMCQEEEKAAKTSKQFVSRSSQMLQQPPLTRRTKRLAKLQHRVNSLEVMPIIVEAIVVVKEVIMVVMEANSKRKADLSLKVYHKSVQDLNQQDSHATDVVKLITKTMTDTSCRGINAKHTTCNKIGY